MVGRLVAEGDGLGRSDGRFFGAAASRCDDLTSGHEVSGAPLPVTRPTITITR
jgi:hypothetical protein